MLKQTELRELRRSSVAGRNRLTQAMRLAGITQVQLAERVGVTQSYISKIANGQYDDLPGEMMRALSVQFGCAIEDLFPARQAVA